MVQGYETTGGYRHIVGGPVAHSRPSWSSQAAMGPVGSLEKEAELGARGPGGPGPGVRMDLLVCPSLQGPPSEKEESELLSDPWGFQVWGGHSGGRAEG